MLMDPTDPRIESAREFVIENFPLGGQRTLAHASFGAAMAFDQLRAVPTECRCRELLTAEDTVARMLVGFEQAAIDNSRWDFAWLLTHLPSVPWQRLCPVRKKGDGIKHASLAEPSWVATAMAFTNETAKLCDFRKKLSTKKEDE